VHPLEAGGGRDHTLKNLLTRRTNLQTPLLAEEQSKRANIRVLLVSNILVRHRIGRNVVHHCQCAGRGAVVSVHVLEPSSACEAEAS
jgi:hypothetical protein